ncbi:type VII secretion target [Mycobacteroides abscessus subsp. abscessus]|nr:type VII secretion target [Mycobacteroides abscessus subsp. abscessus]
MSVNLQFSADDLRQAAIYYDKVAQQCADARAEHSRAVTETESWGPLFYESRRAAVEAINKREQALQTEENKNRELASALRNAATAFDNMTAENVSNLTIRTD